MSHAEDVTYGGQSTVVSAGAFPDTCVSRNVVIIVSGRSFSFGRPAVATGTVQPDGSFSARFSSGVGIRVAQFNLSGRIDGANAAGTISGSNGCSLSFALTKQ
jgi:hypothetical protein